MTLKNICKKYFQAFSAKNLQWLDDNSSNMIHLVDWELNIKGKKKFLDANYQIFKEHPNLKIDLIEQYLDKLVVINIIKIYLSKKNMIKVVDIIEFNKNNKIIKITAFKG